MKNYLMTDIYEWIHAKRKRENELKNLQPKASQKEILYILKNIQPHIQPLTIYYFATNKILNVTKLGFK